MGKNEKRQKRVSYENISPAEKELQSMRRKDIQKACIMRGMPFEYVREYDNLQLESWFIKNYDRSQNNLLLFEFDDWDEARLIKAGKSKDNPEHSHLFHPTMKMSYSEAVPGKNTPANIPSKITKPKKVRVKDETTGIFKGTKKELTFSLIKKGIRIERVIEKVKEKFPDANEKSIRIWTRQCEKKFEAEIKKARKERKKARLAKKKAKK